MKDWHNNYVPALRCCNSFRHHWSDWPLPPSVYPPLGTLPSGTFRESLVVSAHKQNSFKTISMSFLCSAKPLIKCLPVQRGHELERVISWALFHSDLCFFWRREAKHEPLAVSVNVMTSRAGDLMTFALTGFGTHTAMFLSFRLSSEISLLTKPMVSSSYIVKSCCLG